LARLFSYVFLIAITDAPNELSAYLEENPNSNSILQKSHQQVGCWGVPYNSLTYEL